MLDYEYQDGTNSLDSTGVNYSQVQSACPKVARQLHSEFEVIDGEDFGNRGYKLSREASDRDGALKAWRRGCEEVMTRCQRQGLVKDWTVEAEWGPQGEFDTAIKMFDIPASRAGVKLSLSPPWAR